MMLDTMLASFVLRLQLLFCLIALLVGVACRTGSLESSTKNLVASKEPGTKIIHKPQAGCPVGWSESPRQFIELGSGGYEAGCVKVDSSSGASITDYLRPGEGEVGRAGSTVNIGTEPDKPK